MEYTFLSSTVSLKTVSEDAKHGVFEIEGLYAGYGLTVGNALRRALLSSLPGAAATYIKIKNIPHEFTTIPGVKEDVVEIMLNIKKVRFRMHVDEPQTLLLKKKGVGTVSARDIAVTSEVEVVNPEEVLATITDKATDLEIEITVEKGLGYSAVESRKNEKLAIGLVGVDAFFSPVTRVTYSVENMRVGEQTDYNRLRLEIETDGTISPSSALHKTADILKDHFEKVLQVEVKSFDSATEEKAPKKKASKKTSEK